MFITENTNVDQSSSLFSSEFPAGEKFDFEQVFEVDHLYGRDLREMYC